ncbi:hypothetical protein QE331_gp012 [Pseudomonas phage 20Sep416]|uniref:Uncharacterized protein n=7 Tax=Viruses TaxID=10239 RepID=A0A410T8B6_9CAUD|nr:hypothetical protein QE327_gp022 [Pseudomonas phage Henu5]YP_010763536.1 hypothetical protein QE331_gp012 [Pseudomonas phage 20Sep416]QAU05055.1 hypothetical protein Henu5_gp24 [Pseudomonas phage Henu5]WFG37507.1 hypothetical protein 20Sep416_00012 [Pseudomonas phage 20Sep416]
MDCYNPSRLHWRDQPCMGCGVHAMNIKLRKEFDKWWGQDEQEELRKSCAKGWAEYIWMASRRKVSVELPAPEGGFIDIQKYTINRCKEAIRETGLEVF